ncbi:MAG: type II toxin-antitoxin system PemK/MazF family toxin [Chloroflexi bacterium]|nr:type II toxin-antitoxin system PemK/MazF family toxin [Chloroflexota bacterium]
MPKSDDPQRGDIWLVNFNSPMSNQQEAVGAPASKLPTTGDEIDKIRPALVLSIVAKWEVDLRIAVPLRSWKDWFVKNGFFWIVPIQRDGTNRLRKDSGADTFQVKSVATQRFTKRIGNVLPDQLELVATTVAFNIGVPFGHQESRNA